LLINDLPNNLLKALTGENAPPALDTAFIKSLNLGQVLRATVLKTFPGNHALVDIGGQKAISRSSSNIKAGQTVQVKAEKLEPAPVFKIIENPKPSQAEDSLTINSSKAEGKPGTPHARPISIPTSDKLNQLKLKPGEQATVKVVETLSDSKVKINVKGQEIELNLPKNQLKAGDVLTLTANGKKSFDLKLNAPSSIGKGVASSINPSMIQPYLPSKSPLPQLAQNLANLLENIPPNIKLDSGQIKQLQDILQAAVPKQGSPPDAEQLKKQVETIARSTESKLLKALISSETSKPANKIVLGKDLKSQLLFLKTALESQGGAQRTEISSLLNTIKLTVDNLELNQLSNQFSRQEGQPIVLHVPNPFSGHDKQIKIFVRNDPNEESGKGKNKNKQNYSMVFMLNLTSLGKLEIEAKVIGDKVSIKFGADDEEVSRFIQSHISQLHDVLEDLGFSGSTECCVKKVKDIEFEDELGHLAVDSFSKLVDIQT